MEWRGSRAGKDAAGAREPVGRRGAGGRIWGSAKIMAHAIDAANSHHDDAGGVAKVREREEETQSSREEAEHGRIETTATRRGESRRVRVHVTAGTTLEEDGPRRRVLPLVPHRPTLARRVAGGDSAVTAAGGVPPADAGVRGLTVLELGAGCGLCGSRPRRGRQRGHRRRGRPRRARQVNTNRSRQRVHARGCRPGQISDKADDQPLHGEEVVAVETNESGEMIDVGQRRTVAESESESNDANVGLPAARGWNWVHRSRRAATRNLDRLATEADVVLGSDVMYDDVRGSPAASLAADRQTVRRRARRLAVRRASFWKAARRRRGGGCSSARRRRAGAHWGGGGAEGGDGRSHHARGAEGIGSGASGAARCSRLAEG